MTRRFVHRSMVMAALFSSSAFAQTNIADKLDAFIKPFADAGHFYGQIYVARDGKAVYQKALGFTNAELGVRNELDTRIGIASITKPMADVIVLKLIEQNKIAFSDRVSKFISDFPNGDKITVDMLYNHRSGIPYYGDVCFVRDSRKDSQHFVGFAWLYFNVGKAAVAHRQANANGSPGTGFPLHC